MWIDGILQTAMDLAQRLEEHPRIARVHYPGLPSHSDHTIAKAQMPGGFGGVISLEVSLTECTCLCAVSDLQGQMPCWHCMSVLSAQQRAICWKQ